jgi:hypothetical protein
MKLTALSRIVLGKGKVVPALFLNEPHTIKAYWRLEV